MKKARQDAFQEADRKIRDASERIQTQSDQKVQQIRDEEAVKRADLEAENAKLKKMADPTMTEFKVKADVLQQSFNACLSSITSAEAEMSEKMKKALKVVLERMVEQL